MNAKATYKGGNVLLDALPRLELDRLLHHAAMITVEQGETLGFPAEVIHYAYFPIDCVVSLIAQAEGRDSFAFALVGHEGVVGPDVMVGIECWPLRAKVLRGGHALWMSAADFQAAVRGSPTLERSLRDHGSKLAAQFERMSICMGSHTPQRRLAYWLLMIADSEQDDAFFASHPMLAEIAGLSLHSVAATAAHLARSQAITDRQGHWIVVDREELQQAACACYRPPARILRRAVESDHARPRY